MMTFQSSNRPKPTDSEDNGVQGDITSPSNEISLPDISDFLDLDTPSGMRRDSSEKINISDVIAVINADEPGMVTADESNSNEPGMVDEQGMVDEGMVDQTGMVLPSKPYVEIVEQPAMNDARFRYKCEGRCAGSIPGKNSTKDHKTSPAIKIHNYKGKAVVVVSCVTKDKPYKPHPHNLVGKEGCKDGICTQQVIVNENQTIQFPNLGIQCVKKNEVEKSLRQREQKQLDPFKTGFDHATQPGSIDLNVVRLCFQVFLPGPKCFNIPVPPVVSEPICDKKAVFDLKIDKLSHASAPVGGGLEMILLCEKVTKEDIEIHFIEEKNGHVVWLAPGEFQPIHVHKQVAITFRTPSYKNKEVEDPVDVQIKLYRPSDQAYSKPLDFILTPLVNTGRASFWNSRRPSMKKGNYNTFSQILAADSAILAQSASLPEPATTPTIAPVKAQNLGQDVPVVDLTATEQVDVPVDSPDGPMESRMPQMVVTSGLTIGPVQGAEDGTVSLHQDVQEADYAEVRKWQKVTPSDPNGNIIVPSNNNEGEEGCQSLSDLIDQVGAELSEFYEGAKLINSDLSPITDITMAELPPMNDLGDLYDDASYSSLQLAMKNPVSVPTDLLVDNYDNSLALAIANKGPPPLPPILIAAKRESPERAPPPLPPKRAKRAQPEPPSRSLPPTPSGGKSPKTGKQTFFSKLFSKKSPSKSKKDTVSLRAPSVSRENSMHRVCTPTGGSMGNLSRFRDGEDSIFISLRPTEDETLTVVTNADSTTGAPTTILYADTEHLDLYTDMAPRATVSEFDDISSYYSPVEGGRILMADPDVILKRKKPKTSDNSVPRGLHPQEFLLRTSPDPSIFSVKQEPADQMYVVPHGYGGLSPHSVPALSPQMPVGRTPSPSEYDVPQNAALGRYSPSATYQPGPSTSRGATGQTLIRNLQAGGSFTTYSPPSPMSYQQVPFEQVDQQQQSCQPLPVFETLPARTSASVVNPMASPMLQCPPDAVDAQYNIFALAVDSSLSPRAPEASPVTDSNAEPAPLNVNLNSTEIATLGNWCISDQMSVSLSLTDKDDQESGGGKQ